MNTPAPAETPASVLAFWFGSAPAHAAPDPARLQLWFAKQPAVDAAMRERFGAWVDAAGRGALGGWLATPGGRLALILLADQFSRNIHRGTPAAFALDPLARQWAAEGLASGAFDALPPLQRLFTLMPLEHSESLADQDRCVALMRQLRDTVPADGRAAFDGFVDYAERHRDVIRRFGRFPHRNALIGRTSTPEELAFLQTPGSSF